MYDAGQLWFALPGPSRQFDFQFKASICLFLWLVFLAGFVWTGAPPESLVSPSTWLGCLSLTVSIPVLAGVVNILMASSLPTSGLFEKGPLLRGVLTPWNEITSFHWYQMSPESRMVFLVVSAGNRVAYCRMSQQFQSRVDGLMRQFVPAARVPHQVMTADPSEGDPA
jgi:hypothetical protein